MGENTSVPGMKTYNANACLASFHVNSMMRPKKGGTECECISDRNLTVSV